MIDDTKILAAATAELEGHNCVVASSPTTTRVTVGETTFEIDLVDGDGKPRTQADIEAIVRELCRSADAK